MSVVVEEKKMRHDEPDMTNRSTEGGSYRERQGDEQERGGREGKKRRKVTSTVKSNSFIRPPKIEATFV